MGCFVLFFCVFFFLWLFAFCCLFLKWAFNLKAAFHHQFHLIPLHIFHMCCAWLLKYHYRLSKSLCCYGKKNRFWPEYLIRINDIFPACHVKNKYINKLNHHYGNQNKLSLQNFTAYCTWGLLLKNNFWKSGNFSSVLNWGQTLLETSTITNMQSSK